MDKKTEIVVSPSTQVSETVGQRKCRDHKWLLGGLWALTAPWAYTFLIKFDLRSAVSHIFPLSPVVTHTKQKASPKANANSIDSNTSTIYACLIVWPLGSKLATHTLCTRSCFPISDFKSTKRLRRQHIIYRAHTILTPRWLPRIWWTVTGNERLVSVCVWFQYITSHV